MSGMITTSATAPQDQPRTARFPAPDGNRAARRRRLLRSRLSSAGLLLVTLVVVAPILLMLKVSLQSDSDLAANPLSIPSHLNFHNYVAAFSDMNYGRSVFNTVLITGGAAVLVLLTGSLAAWPLARLTRRWTKVVYQGFVAGLTSLPGSSPELVPRSGFVAGLTTLVPVPSSVNSSTSTQCSTRPSITCALGTPPATARRHASILGTMPESSLGRIWVSAAVSISVTSESRLGQSV